MSALKTDYTPLTGKGVLVTGGTTGIGRATVKMLVAEGARVLTFGRHRPELETSLENARGGHGEVFGLTADVATREGVEQVFAEVLYLLLAEAVDVGEGFERARSMRVFALHAMGVRASSMGMGTGGRRVRSGSLPIGSSRR